MYVQFTADGSKADFIVYVIAIPANRYDLLCMEGFARAIRIFIGAESAPVYSKHKLIIFLRSFLKIKSFENIHCILRSTKVLNRLMRI